MIVLGIALVELRNDAAFAKFLKHPSYGAARDLRLTCQHGGRLLPRLEELHIHGTLVMVEADLFEKRL